MERKTGKKHLMESPRVTKQWWNIGSCTQDRDMIIVIVNNDDDELMNLNICKLCFDKNKIYSEWYPETSDGGTIK